MQRLGWISRSYGGVLGAMHLGFLVYLAAVTIDIQRDARDPYRGGRPRLGKSRRRAIRA